MEMARKLHDHALERGQLSAGVAAVKTMGVLSGKWIERAEIGAPGEFETMTDDELITNAVKYGTGRITVSLEPNPEKGYALSVSNDGPGLPEGFDPADRKGLGMRIIRSLVKQIGGELRNGETIRTKARDLRCCFPEMLTTRMPTALDKVS